MQTIKIEIENSIYKKISDSGINLQEKFREMIYDLLDDGYPSISTKEAKKRVENAVRRYKDGTMKTISHNDMWSSIESDCKVTV